MKRFDNELKELERTIKAKKEEIDQAELDLTKAKHDIANLEKDEAALQNAIKKLEKEEKWILEDHKEFGEPGGRYDINADVMEGLQARKKELQESQRGKKGKINENVMTLIEKYAHTSGRLAFLVPPY